MIIQITIFFLICFISIVGLGLLSIFTHLIERLILWIKRKIKGEQL